jgi:tetratricopeptide (TPR) repeat protein
MELTAELDAEDEEVASLAIHSRLLQLQYAWRVGMSREEEARLATEAEEIAKRNDDLHSQVLLKVATQVRPGLPHYGPDWIEAVRETVAMADQTEDRHLRAAVRGAGAYAYLCVADFEGFERILDEMLEIVGDDGSVGSGIILGSPIAWGLMGKGMIRRERLEFDEAEELFDRALAAALEEDDPETASWVRSNQASLVFRKDPEAALAIARRNVELTDRLGDVFSRSLALSNLGWVQLIAEENEAALESIEASERLYREAMDNGGELEGWRGQLLARALVGVGRTDEALEVAERAARVAGERKMYWSYPVAALTLARARAAAGVDGVEEAFEEAERVARECGSETLLMDIATEREQLGTARTTY